MMRVGIIADAIPPWGVGGNPHEAGQIIKSLLLNDVEVSAFCYSSLGLQNGKENLINTCLSYLGLSTSGAINKFRISSLKPIFLLPHLAFLVNPQATLILFRYLTRQKLDALLTYCGCSPVSLPLAMVKNIVQTTLVTRLTGNDIFVDAIKRPFIVKPVFSSSDLLIATSTYMQSLICLNFPHITKKIKVIPWAIDTDTLTPEVDGSTVRAKYGIEHEFVILFMSRLEERKGPKELIFAMKNVVKEDPRARLIIVGEGPLEHSLYNLAKSLGVVRNVVFEKYVSDDLVPKYYAACDVFVFPYRVDQQGVSLPIISNNTDPFPIGGKVLLEAAACGRPIVSTRGRNLSMFAEGSNIGMIVRQEDPKALAEAIMEIRRNPAKAREAAKNARKIVLEKYSCDKVMAQWLSLFKDLN
jgi:glycosyltransferase involved in cell wall biosynthesis